MPASLTTAAVAVRASSRGTSTGTRAPQLSQYPSASAVPFPHGHGRPAPAAGPGGPAGAATSPGGGAATTADAGVPAGCSGRPQPSQNWSPSATGSPQASQVTAAVPALTPPPVRSGRP